MQYPPFHEAFLARVKGLDIMDASSIVVAQHIAADGWTKVPADKIRTIEAVLGAKMTDVQTVESPYVEQVVRLLQQADAGLQGQIAAYRLEGNLSDDQLDLPLPNAGAAVVHANGAVHQLAK